MNIESKFRTPPLLAHLTFLQVDTSSHCHLPIGTSISPFFSLQHSTVLLASQQTIVFIFRLSNFSRCSSHSCYDIKAQSSRIWLTTKLTTLLQHGRYSSSWLDQKHIWNPTVSQLLRLDCSLRLRGVQNPSSHCLPSLNILRRCL